MKSERRLVVTVKTFFFRVHPYKCCIKATKFQVVALGYLEVIDLSLDGKEAGRKSGERNPTNYFPPQSEKRLTQCRIFYLIGLFHSKDQVKRKGYI